MLKNDIVTKLASINVFELLVFVEQGKKGHAVADIESRIINLEIYRREKLNLQQITPSWITKNLFISAPKANKLINKLIEKGLVRKVKDKVDRRIIRLIATPLAIVRYETYLSTILLAMDTAKIFTLTKKDKEIILGLINNNADTPMLKDLDPKKLKVINSLWSKI